MNNTNHLPRGQAMSATVELMSQEEFEAYLAKKYGAGSYGLKVARAEAGRVKATLKLKAPAEPVVAAPVVVPEPPAVDLDALGARWRTGEKIAALAREAGYASWNKLWSDLAQRGYRPQSA
jgi:hypothetical protein